MANINKDLKESFKELLKQGVIVSKETLAEYYFEKKGNRHPDWVDDKTYEENCKKYKQTKVSLFFSSNENHRKTFSRVMNEVAVALAESGIDIKYNHPTNNRKKPCFYKWPEGVSMDKLDTLIPIKKKDDFIVDIIREFDNLIPDSLVSKKIRERIETNTEKYISFDTNQNLKNLDLLPSIIVAVKEKKVIRFKYRKDSTANMEEVILHPHYIKEFNNRWFVFGYKNEETNSVPLYPIDRIVKREGIEYVDDICFVESQIDYNTYFDDIIGVTHFKESEIEHIKIRTMNSYIHELIYTKKLHDSQIETKPFDPELNYGEFTLDVKYNPELIGRLFMYESNIKVITEKGSKIYKSIRYHISKMAEIYNVRFNEE